MYCQLLQKIETSLFSFISPLYPQQTKILNENMMCFLGSFDICVNNELSIDFDHSIDKWNMFLWVICCRCVVVSLKFVDLWMKHIQ